MCTRVIWPCRLLIVGRSEVEADVPTTCASKDQGSFVA